MSATCHHTDADAFAHPTCAGCAALVSDVAARAGATNAAERAALSHTARHGVWAGEDRADVRELTQAETDLLIRFELWQLRDFVPSGPELAEFESVVGRPYGLKIYRSDLEESLVAQCQRGGISSDPRVRLLAFRVWGDRDLRWFDNGG